MIVPIELEASRVRVSRLDLPAATAVGVSVTD
jgi:hypothetical protein